MIARMLIHPDLFTREKALESEINKLNFSNPHPDLLYLEDKLKLGVEQAKAITQHLSLKPFQAKGRAVVVVSAQNLTLDAQNSLLKILEEPPEEAIILLASSSESNLLPTFLSRCQVEILTSTSPKTIDTSYFAQIEQLINSSMEERFVYIEKLTKREEFLLGLIHYFHQAMRKDPKLVKYNQILLQAQQWQSQNVNLRAILEYLMLKLPNQQNSV